MKRTIVQLNTRKRSVLATASMALVGLGGLMLRRRRMA